MLYDPLIRNILFALADDPEVAHEKVLKLLRRFGNTRIPRDLVHKLLEVTGPRIKQELFGVEFNSPVGLAGGFDKNAVAIDGLAALGFGFIEIGTVTQHPQEGHPRPRIFRLPKDRALINKMGFPNEGAKRVAARLKERKQKFETPKVPIGISIGKSKITEPKDVVSDYLFSFGTLYPYADYFVVNVSSPNTPGLRKLQDKKILTEILTALSQRGKELSYPLARKSILVKISPDLEFSAISDVLDCMQHVLADGIIATNTSISRDGLINDPGRDGGLSGDPIFERALEVVSFIADRTEKKLPIIAVGGISSGEDAMRMIQAGAKLIQIYSAFVYKGPLLPHRMNRHIQREFTKNGRRFRK